ncbi:Excalibur calcium-binding domain-containing protein [Agrococcus baldri]|uniref:Excalibur calcium-binding domain-containing protein n=1 Tax=Agrococcus baldri TaxID=153730 RepID=A0AA94L0C7_9MICO|nr:cell wall-binding repeat-containing protein [Agrococcus baldri]SFS15638.1 Excalibur calcium-binding domain-containing protein [Agrococcus baldri]
MRRTFSRALTIGTLALMLGSVSLVAAGPAPEANAMSVMRIAGADRYATSVAISRQMAWIGDTVYLASGSKFPDALAAGPVAAAEDAHLLLTPRDALPGAVATRLSELGPSEVVLVGDEQSISVAVAAQIHELVPGATVTRVAGGNRYETALKLLDRLSENAAILEVWVVAGSKFPDALVAGSIAGQRQGAIVLDPNGARTTGIDAWIAQVSDAVAGVPVRIAGSEASVSRSTENALRNAGAASVNRYAGANRYETARVIHDAFSTSVPTQRMLLATGQNFPDALGGSLLAANNGEPLYLAPSSCNTNIASMLRGERDQRGITTVVGLGGIPSLSERALRLEDCPPPPPPAPAPTPKPTPGPAPAPPAGPPPSSGVNCSDFRTWAAAQAWFLYWYPSLGDVAGLDRNNDMIACESLPGSPGSKIDTTPSPEA